MSAMTAEWFERKISHLNEINNDNEKREILEDLRLKLRSLTSLELVNVACGLDLARLFAELTSKNSDYVEEVCLMMTILLESLEPGDIHKRYPMEVLQCLSHQQPAVKILVLKELDRIAEDSEKVIKLLNDLNLLIRVMETISDDNLKVATAAMDVAKKAGRTAEGCKIIYTGNLLRILARLLAKNDVITFRVYEVIVEIARSSKEGLEASANSGFLTSLIRLLDDEDVLIQLNALEALTDLAINNDGLNYLEERGILKKLSDQIAKANENPLSHLLIPGLMKFFGNVARCRPNEVFGKYPIVISALFHVIDGDDLVLLSNALDTLGHISSRVEGKYALESLGDAMPRAMRRISEIIQKLPTELRLRGLENLALILHIDKERHDNRILSLTKYWFDLLDNEPLNVIVSLCKQPFADIRQASLQVLVEIASQVWGQEYIAMHPGLSEFLLDRNAEAFKNCKEIKYEIVKNLSEASPDIFESSVLQSFREFVSQGAFHVDLEREVITEGAT